MEGDGAALALSPGKNGSGASKADEKEARNVAPPKPVRSSLAIKEKTPVLCEEEMDASVSIRCVSNGETENEADISSLSSHDGEINGGLVLDVNLVPRVRYPRGQTGGGDTSGGEETESTIQKHASQICKVNGHAEQSTGTKTPNRPQELGEGRVLISDADNALGCTSPKAVLDLDDAGFNKDNTSWFLDGIPMHEFHSSSSAGVACELRTDVVGRERGRSVAEVKELAYARLQEELLKAQEELKLKDEEVGRLSRIRDQVGEELEELTACLFEEAHKMVREANIQRAAADKSLREANMKIEVLQAEVQALKALVLTSTPAMPNKHLHPHLEPRKEAGENGGMKFLRGHKRSPSHNNLRYGRDATPPGSPEKEQLPTPFCPENYEVDLTYHKEFVSWREKPELDRTHAFLARIYSEDIDPCLNFSNNELASTVQECVQNNSISIEAVTGKSPFPKRCALTDAPRICKYRMKLGDSDQWYYISQLCRNRIAAVCDFLSYLRYIEQGLVRSGVHDVYWEVIRLRKHMALARLGIS